MADLQTDNARFQTDIAKLKTLESTITGFIAAQTTEIASLKAASVDTTGLEANLAAFETELGNMGGIVPAPTAIPTATDSTGTPTS